MNVHELFANIALSREQMTLITKFINNQINTERNSVHALFTNRMQTGHPGYSDFLLLAERPCSKVVEILD